jgi:hypothetical protein
VKEHWSKNEVALLFFTERKKVNKAIKKNEQDRQHRKQPKRVQNSREKRKVKSEAARL